MLRKLLGSVVAIIVGGLACFYVAMAFIYVVSPPLGSDRWVTTYVASLSVIAVAACRYAWPVVSSRVSKFDSIAIDPLNDDELSLRIGIRDFRRRGRWCRLVAMVVLFFMVVVALLGFTVAARSFADNARQPSGSLASLVLLVILIRIFASICRYNLRLSSFYDARADYLRLAGNVKALSHKELLELVGTDELDTTSIREFWHSLFGRSSLHETKDTKPPSP